MSDWQVGDLAVCVDTAKRGCWHATYIKQGTVYAVRGAYRDQDGDHVLALEGVAFPYLSDRFRKITPDKREACEDEFITLLKRGKVSARDQHILDGLGDD
jgi:hypothetical protein